MTKLKGPKHVSSVCVGGKEYAVKDGRVDVPDEHAHHLVRHGFTVVPDDRQEKKARDSE